MARAKQDQYANMANSQVTTAGTAVVSSEVLMGVSLGEGKGILIDQIDYNLNVGLMGDFAADSDFLRCGWFAQDPSAVGDFAYDNARMIHLHETMEIDHGTPGVANILHMPIVHQFFPPIILAAPRLFFACVGSANITGAAVYSRLYFRYVDLSSQEYLELAETFVLIG